MKVGVFTLGCKVNQCESTAIISALNELGHCASGVFAPADVYIINTCSVTSEADRKSRQMVTRALKQNPSAKVIILGCSSQNSPQAYSEKANVIAVSGTQNKTQSVLNAISALQNGELDLEENASNHPSLIPQEQSFDSNPFSSISKQANDAAGSSDMASRSRAYIKVQDGCNNFCSYCIVPYLRGRSQSRSISEIVAEAQSLAAITHEIVITGINISAYSTNPQSPSDISQAKQLPTIQHGGLGELVSALSSVPVRKRLGSLECGIIDEDFLRRMADSDFCDHFHLSLQSGSGRVLKMMNRHYTPQEFLQRVELIRKFFPYAGITTDVITGFPQESSADHEETVAFLKEAAFSDVHVFPYSKRSGTNAAKMIQTEKHIIEERAAQLNLLKNNLKTAFFARNLGRVLKVFIEDSDGEYNSGYTSNYIKVFSHAPRHSFLNHKLQSISSTIGVIGSIAE